MTQAADLLNMPLPPSISELELERVSSHETLFYKPISEVDLYDLTHGATTERTAPPVNLEVSLTSEHGSRDRSSFDPASLPPTVYRYMATICSQVVSKDGSLREEALAEMRSSKRINLILPHLIQFIDLRLRDNALFSGFLYIILSI